MSLSNGKRPEIAEFFWRGWDRRHPKVDGRPPAPFKLPQAHSITQAGNSLSSFPIPRFGEG